MLEGRPDEELALRRRAAEVAEQELGSTEDADAQLRRCLVVRPDDPEILADLTRVAIAGQRWEEVADLLHDRAGRRGRRRAARAPDPAGRGTPRAAAESRRPRRTSTPRR